MSKARNLIATAVFAAVALLGAALIAEAGAEGARPVDRSGCEGRLCFAVFF